MGKEKIISEDNKNEIARLYMTNEFTSKEALGKVFNITKKKCAEILNEMGVKTIKSHERRKVNPVINGDKYIPTNEYTYIAKHKETGYEIADFNNVSGKLTTYLLTLNPNLIIETKAIRATYYKKTGNYWYEEFFDIIKTPIIVKKMRGELTDSDISEIIKLYSTGENKNIKDLAEKFSVGLLKIKDILTKNNVEINKKGGQTKLIKKKKIYLKKPCEKYQNTNDTIYKAVCKKTGIEFEDFLNNSGVLTRHIRENHPLADIKNSKHGIKYFKTTGEYWYEEYFDILPFKKAMSKKCAYCDFEMPLNVSTKQYKRHLSTKHNINIFEHLKNYPEDKDLFGDDWNKLTQMKDKNNWVKCAICGEKMGIVGYSHLTKHNITTYEYKIKYGANVSKNAHTILSNGSIALNASGKCLTYISKPEKEIRDYLTELNVKFETNRKMLIGKEIDILVKDKKIGIEFNGNKWHSEWFGKKDKFYHLNKTLKCNEKGYSLIHVFEDELMYKKEIVLSKIKHLIGCDTNLEKIAGRKTIVREISSYEESMFLDTFHIQGSPQSNSTVSLGCFYNDKLISVMLFKVLNKNAKDYDLTRFATDFNYVCQGVASKMLSYFIKNYNPDSIISFADRRWTLNKENNLYTKLGFELVDELKPDYRYYNEKIDRYQRFHKFGFRKQKLSKKYGFPLSMTEKEMVQELGYDRIWDCGLFKYKLSLKK
jgi:hypothetical protein